MKKTAVQIVKQFEADIQTIVRKAWPGLVAQALQNPKKPKPKRTISDREYRSTLVKRTDRKHLSLAHAVEIYGSKRAAAAALGLAETTFRDRLKLEAAGG